MSLQIVLASSSSIRSTVLKNAGVEHEILPAKIDEDSVISAMLSENAPDRDIADTLADMKAQKASLLRPQSYVLGCDQVLSFGESLYSKPETKQDLGNQLKHMQGKTHKLISAAAIYKDMQPIWRYVGLVTLSMRTLSDEIIAKYIDANGDSVKYCAGGYEIEGRGAQFFDNLDGDYFCILGIPLLDVISFLKVRGVLES